jgi:ADP-ribosylglycohydrolase
MHLDTQTYYDKVYGCWLGKNAGGTLGEPLERLYGQEEPFTLNWYPKLVPGGLPNDDLEIQLVWLQALKERGLDITAKDLAAYWLKCIIYNPDEYGLHKTNLRKGLLPPVSGWYNNWFKHCMGSPIRSEIWACIAPGLPAIAAKYAYEDAICDHAGGESVYGEIFNASLESMAFFCDDKVKLVQWALHTIPSNCKTHFAISTALESYNKKLSWLVARKEVMNAVYHPVAQYSPINLGFQTIGLLYGEDFGDALLKAVNCGWDTDCTGATVGAIWGIIHGKSGLPQKWIEPLGDKVMISRGIQNLTAPTDLDSLTKETCLIGEKIVERWGHQWKIPVVGSVDPFQEIGPEPLKDIEKLWSIVPNQMELPISSNQIQLSVIYPDGPAILPDRELNLVLKLSNLTNEKISGYIILTHSQTWRNSLPSKQIFELEPHGSIDFASKIQIPLNEISYSQKIPGSIIIKSASDVVIPFEIPIVGSYRWFYSPVFTEASSIKTKFSPESFVERFKMQKFSDLGGGWHPISFAENALLVENFFNKSPGVVYLRHYLYSPEKRVARLGVPNNSWMMVWLNGRKIRTKIAMRPNLGGEGVNYAFGKLRKGWNVIQIKLFRGNEPVEAHFTIAHRAQSRGMDDILQSAAPWER